MFTVEARGNISGAMSDIVSLSFSSIDEAKRAGEKLWWGYRSVVVVGPKGGRLKVVKDGQKRFVWKRLWNTSRTEDRKREIAR